MATSLPTSTSAHQQIGFSCWCFPRSKFGVLLANFRETRLWHEGCVAVNLNAERMGALSALYVAL